DPSWTFDTGSEAGTLTSGTADEAPAEPVASPPDGPRPVTARPREPEPPNPAAMLLDAADRDTARPVASPPDRSAPPEAPIGHEAPLTSARPAPAFVDPASPLWHAV